MLQLLPCFVLNHVYQERSRTRLNLPWVFYHIMCRLINLYYLGVLYIVNFQVAPVWIGTPAPWSALFVQLPTLFALLSSWQRNTSPQGSLARTVGLDRCNTAPDPALPQAGMTKAADTSERQIRVGLQAWPVIVLFPFATGSATPMTGNKPRVQIFPEMSRDPT